MPHYADPSMVVGGVILAPSLLAGTVVAVEVGAIAATMPALPKTESAPHATLHLEDTSPAAIGAAGTLKVVAAPVRSTWQSDTIAGRLILHMSWVKRSPATVQFFTVATWWNVAEAVKIRGVAELSAIAPVFRDEVIPMNRYPREPQQRIADPEEQLTGP